MSNQNKSQNSSENTTKQQDCGTKQNQTNQQSR